MKRLTTLGALFTVAVCMTGCFHSGAIGDNAEIRGTPEGLRAMFDGLNGIVKTSKDSADTENDYMKYRIQQEAIRNQAPKGFLQKMFGGTETEAKK